MLTANDKLVVFDFDGTLVDSNPIKLNAFNICFAEFISAYPEILAYCHANHHTPRWEKFRYVYEKILNRPYTGEIEYDLHRRYADATTRAVIDAPEILGALDFVRVAAMTHEIALISSTPHDVLGEILEGRGWTGLFKHWRGAPMKKSQWIDGLMQGLFIAKNETVFIGDTAEDKQSAKEAGCRFIGVVNEELGKDGTPFLKNFIDLKAVA